jgi:hypothetical protein
MRAEAQYGSWYKTLDSSSPHVDLFQPFTYRVTQTWLPGQPDQSSVGRSGNNPR